MNIYGKMTVYFYAFLTSAVDGRKQSASRPGRFTSGERAPGIPWIGVGPRVGLETGEEKNIIPLPRFELRSSSLKPPDHWNKSDTV
jgi:hypothetical protein